MFSKNPHTIDFKNIGTSFDSNGVPVNSSSDVSIKCNVQRAKPSLMVKKDGENTKVNLIVYITLISEIETFNNITNPSQFEYDGFTYNVLKINNYQKHIEVYG